MNNTFIIPIDSPLAWVNRVYKRLSLEKWVLLLSTTLAVVTTIYCYRHGWLITYGDAESHLNIAKRVVDSLTPGFAQLGGIWLPLPHVLLIPFVYFDFLWRTGLAGSIVSGIAFVISSLYLYKLGHLLTRSKAAAFFGALVFMVNPDILYLQSTAMTELTLIVFFILSSYFFIRFLLDDTKLLMLIAAAGFGFLASLSRYDGWALVMMEAGVLFLYYFPFEINPSWFSLQSTRVPLFIKSSRDVLLRRWHILEGREVLFMTLAFFGIVIWFAWGWLILGDPLYFTHSQFSANSQQMGWLAKGELPAYHHALVSLIYYTFTSVETVGTLLAAAAIFGLISFGFSKESRQRWLILLVLLVPFFFNVLTLFIGQSIIFLPGVTPTSFEWTLFNVRYGAMMVPAVAILVGYLFYRSRVLGRSLIACLLLFQITLFSVGFTPVLSWQDGVMGLSSLTGKLPDAQQWLDKNYDYGDVLMDDYERTLSIVKSPIEMQNIIYIGTKPYWQQSLAAPERYARWIIIQRGDAIWNTIYEDPTMNGRLYKYFEKTYTSDEILIFERNNVPAPNY